MSDYVRNRGEIHGKDQEKSTQETSQESQSRASCEMLLRAREGQQKAVKPNFM